MGTLLHFPPREARDSTARVEGDVTPKTRPAQVVSLSAARSIDPAREFQVAYHAAMIARAERELIEVRWLADHHLSAPGSNSPLRDHRGPAFDKMLAAIERLADLPAMTPSQLRMKKSAIGSMWLSAEGERYDRYRQSVAADEARLVKKRRR